MKTLLLAIALSACPVTKIVNKTVYPLNNHDRDIMKTCQKRCVVHFPDSPCLKLFEKVDEQGYHCICGK